LFKKKNTIDFYHKDQPYYEFSNYAVVDLIINDNKYMCTEQFYQVCKFYDISNKASLYYSWLILQCDSPQKTRSMGYEQIHRFGNKWLINKNKPELGNINDAIRQHSDLKIVSNWEFIKEDVMYVALKAKFTQNKKCYDLLLSTCEKTIIEDSKIDFYWGIGNGAGKNRLGFLLMKLRNKLQN